jgi:hypothetical protein
VGNLAWRYFKLAGSAGDCTAEILDHPPAVIAALILIVDLHRADKLLSSQDFVVDGSIRAIVATPPMPRYGLLYALIEGCPTYALGLRPFRLNQDNIPVNDVDLAKFRLSQWPDGR